MALQLYAFVRSALHGESLRMAVDCRSGMAVRPLSGRADADAVRQQRDEVLDLWVGGR
jgi:hypothetical protein